MNPFDYAIRDAVHGLSSAPITALMQGLSFVGSDVFMGVLCAIAIWWMWKVGNRHNAIVLIIGFLAAELVTEILKLIFHRPRPTPFFGIAAPNSYSFPSGHSLKSAVVYILLAMLLTSRVSVRIGAVVLAFLIGLSRIYLGVHYPTDVLGGFAFAAICLAAVSYRRMPV